MIYQEFVVIIVRQECIMCSQLLKLTTKWIIRKVTKEFCVQMIKHICTNVNFLMRVHAKFISMEEKERDVSRYSKTSWLVNQYEGNNIHGYQCLKKHYQK